MTTVLIRAGRQTDVEVCVEMNHHLETDLVWQMKMSDSAERTQISFQTLRLPRSIRVEYPIQAPERQQELESLTGFLVAEAEDVILGYTLIKLADASQGAWIRHLVVDDLWRRKNIGRLLLQQTQAWARRKNATTLTVETTTRSYPAIRFLMSQGFNFCGFHDRYYTNQDIAIFFGKSL